MSFYKSYNQGGQNPYAQELQTAQTVYQNDSQGYYALQGAEQQYKAAEAAESQAQAGLTSAQNGVQQAQVQYQATEQSLQVAQQAYADRTLQQNAVDQAANQVKQEQAAVQSAEANLLQILHPQTPGNTADAQAGVQTAQAGVQVAQEQLKAAEVTDGYTVLRAPANGIVTQKNASIGDVVSPGQPVLQMDVNQLQVYIAISQAQLANVRIGDTIQMTVSALPGHTFVGKVFEVDPTPAQGNGTMNEYRVKATLDNASSLVKPGMNGNVTVKTDSTQAGITIPAMSLQQVNGVYGVYLIASGLKTPQAGNGATSALSGPLTQLVDENLPKGVYFQPVNVGLMGPDHVPFLFLCKSELTGTHFRCVRNLTMETI